MNVTFKFFDESKWSIFATLQTIIILLIYRLGFKKFNLKLLVLSSLLSMMKGDILSKLIFAFFLSLITWSKDEYIKGTLLTIIATFITSMIKENNVIHKLFMKHTILRYILYLSIFIWFVVILRLIYSEKIKLK